MTGPATIASALAAAAERWPGQPAVLWNGEVELTTGELDRLTEAAAVAWTGLGLSAGDAIGVMLRNRPEYVVAYFAAARARLTIVPINRRAASAEVVRILRDAGARAFVTEPLYEEAAALVDDEMPGVHVLTIRGDGAIGDPAGDRPAVHGEDLAANPVQAIHYTSGTTGEARGAVRSHRANQSVIDGTLAALGFRPGDLWFSTLPMHSVGFYPFMAAPVVAGGGLVITEEVDPRLTLDLVSRHRVSMLHAVPTVWEMLMRANEEGEGNRLGSVRTALWGASPLPQGTADRLLTWMSTPVLGCYGSTEAPCITYATLDGFRSGRTDSSGYPIPGVELRIAGADGEPLPAGEPGEILIRGEPLMDGYFHQDDLTDAAFDAGGWYHSGDLGRLDHDGALTVVGRTKDMIVSGGENVYPAEVESVISRLPGVVNAAVVGVPDPLWGQVVTAFVVSSDPEPSADAIVSGVRASLAGYKVPRAVHFIDEMPTNALGKVPKPDLVRLAASLDGRSPAASTTTTHHPGGER